jgi:hypothetical protein
MLMLQALPAAGQEEPADHYLRASFMLGAGWPVGDMNVHFDPGFVAGARGEYTLSPMTRVGAQLAFHSFDHEPLPGTVDNEGIIDLSLIAKAVGSWGAYDPFALIGLGAFVTKDQVSNGRRWDGGLQLGGGLGLEVSEHLTVLVGTSFYMVFRGGENSDYLWIDGYLGFDLRQP